MKLMDMDEVEGRFFVRVSDTTMDEVEKAFGDEADHRSRILPEEFGLLQTYDRCDESRLNNMGMISKRLIT